MGVVRESGLDAWSYGAAWGAVCGGSRRLGEAGVRHGERLGILGETEPGWGVAELSALHCGAVAVPLDVNHPDAVLRSILDDCGAAGLLASRAQADRARGLLPGRPVFVFDELFDRERDAGLDAPPAPVEPDHPRLLVYTSGTTGTPKGVTLTERNVVSQLEAILQAVPLGSEETLLSVLPLSHMFAQILNLLGPLYIGASVRFAEGNTPQAVRMVLERGGVTGFGAVPQFFSLFRDRVFSEMRARGALTVRAHALLVAVSRGVRTLTGKNPGRYLFPTIHRAFGGRLHFVVCGGSFLDPQLGRQLQDWGFNLLIAYGLTEGTAGATVTEPGNVDVRTVGRPLPGHELRIEHPNEEGVGEILIRGPSVMAGYWRRPDATREVIDEQGWLHSGDLGRFDARGNLVICGRAKEMIVLASGKNVFPQELDDHYAGHELIREVCVVGLPEPGGGERLHAVVVPDFDAFRQRGTVTIDDYIRFEMETLSLQLPSYQRVLSYSIWREPLPRTPTRKVRRLEVRDLVIARRAAGPAPARRFESTEEDRRLLASDTMRAVIEAGSLLERGVDPIHPDMSLEFDLGLDSLARAEMIAHLSSIFGVEPEAMSSVMTPREMVRVLEARGTAAPEPEIARQVSWSDLLDDPDARRDAERRLGGGRGRRTLASATVGFGLRTLARAYFRLRVVGVENLERAKRPYVLAVNHVSMGDAFLVAAALPSGVRRDVFYLGYAGHLQGWLRGLFARAVDVVPVDTGRRLTHALQLGVAGLRLGRILMIFPEGERSVDGRLRPFKQGPALLIRHARAAAVPVAIVGAHELWGRDRRVPRRGTVTVAFGDPVEFGGDHGGDEDVEHARITRMLRERVARLVESNGGPPPHPDES
jgi:long-chain acyl-CoA synthetase